jgi:hypothetical protein
MLLTTALLAIYCAYAFSIGSIEDSIPVLVGGVVSIFATYGAAMVRPWSRYLVYVLAAGFVAKLFGSFVDAIRAGYFQFQFGSVPDIIWSLTPSLLMVAVSFVCCIVVHRQFRPEPAPVLAASVDRMPGPVEPKTEPSPPAGA